MSEDKIIPPVFGKWQLCPKCHGQGTMSKPPGMPGDVNEWSGSQSSYACDVCEGNKIIECPIIEVIPEKT